jgi:hypothetical protein
MASPRSVEHEVLCMHGTIVADRYMQELYEPLFEDFYRESQQNGIRIRDIWIADAAWQGQSGVLNGEKLGDDRTCVSVSSSNICSLRSSANDALCRMQPVG